MAIAFVGLLVLLRLEADRFGAAEYAEHDRYGERPRILRGLGWYGLAVILIIALFVVQPSGNRLLLRMGDRNLAIVWGLLYGAAGFAQALGFAYLRYRHLRLPDVRSYPLAVFSSLGTACVDEIIFRGGVLGVLVFVGLDLRLAVVTQALLYGLATRLGAPGRNLPMLGIALGVGLVSGWVTLATGGIAAAFIGHGITRFANFVTTGHAGQPAPSGHEVEEIEKVRRPPEGWSTVSTAGDSRRDR